MYVSEFIGDEYLNWKSGEKIVIPTQTGSGKTHFILQKLLPDAAKDSLDLVYFCNRRALHDQVLHDLQNRLKNMLDGDDAFIDRCMNHLKICTYQECEARGGYQSKFKYIEHTDTNGKVKKERTSEKEYGLSGAKYFVFDEAHYFISDALFNRRIMLWNRMGINSSFPICVFLTATPEPLLCFLNCNMLGMSIYANDLYKVIVGKNPYEDQELQRQCWETSQGTVFSVIETTAPSSSEAPLFRSFFIFKLWGAPEFVTLMQSPFQNEQFNPLGEPFTVTDPQGRLFSAQSIASQQPFCQQYLVWDKDNYCFFARSDSSSAPLWQAVYHLKSPFDIDPDKFRKDQINVKMRDLFFAVERSIKDIKDACDWYKTFPFSYDYATTYYFDNEENIVARIRRSPKKEKWILFVDKKAEGIRLFSKIKEALDRIYGDNLASDVAYIDASESKSNKYNSRTALQQIESENAFHYKVLICTSVLDCGVNIIDENLKNIVIYSSDKTSFIQMLGRVRVKDSSTRINVFVKFHSYKSINAALKETTMDIKNMCFLYMYSQIETFWSYDPNEIFGIKITGKNIIRGPYVKKVTDALSFANVKYAFIMLEAAGNDSKEGTHLLKVRYNELAWINRLYAFYNLQKAIDQYNAEKDPHFFLKEQLSWFLQEYDSSRWIEDIDATKELCDFLDSIKSKKLNVDEQKEFALKCLRIFEKFHTIPKQIKANRSRYRANGTFPKKNALGSAFREIGLPYKISSKNERSTKTNYWIIT